MADSSAKTPPVGSPAKTPPVGSPAKLSPGRSPTRSPAGGQSPADIHAAATPIEADDGASTDGGSSIDDRISSYTASLSSSIVDYPVENGRRYHAFRRGAYALPNDDREMERLDIAHALVCRATGDKLYLAPLEKENVYRVLDIGTGTGIWAIEIADEFPNAEIIGNDLSAIQPTWVPPNVKFEIDDVESPWVETKKYDYIFVRHMLVSIQNWPRLVKNIYDHLNPGGWAEFQDMDSMYYSDDGTLTEEHETRKWNKELVNAFEEMGRTGCPGPQLEGWVTDAGFENITHQRFKCPIGPWPRDPFYKDVGMLNLIQTLDGLEAFTLQVFCGFLGKTKEETLVVLAKVREELKAGAFHAIWDHHVVYAQKPADAEEGAADQ